MDSDPRGNPDNMLAATAPDEIAAPDKTTAPGPTVTQTAGVQEAGLASGFDMVDAIALEAVTAVLIPTQARSTLNELRRNGGDGDEAGTVTTGPDEDSAWKSEPIIPGEADPM